MLGDSAGVQDTPWLAEKCLMAIEYVSKIAKGQIVGNLAIGLVSRLLAVDIGQSKNNVNRNHHY